MRARGFIIAGLAVALVMAHGPAPAQQSYPSRPMRMLVGFPPGGTSDILARTISARLGAALGQPVIVENRPGASGNIAADDGCDVQQPCQCQARARSVQGRCARDNGSDRGQISIMFDNVPPLLPHVKAGKMRALAVTSLRRIAALPDIPTLDEAGLKGFDSVGWNGVFVPHGTSREIIDRLQSEIVKVLAIPEIRDGLIAQGADPVGNSPEAFGAWVKLEVQKWAKVVRDSGARVD